MDANLERQIDHMSEAPYYLIWAAYPAFVNTDGISAFLPLFNNKPSLKAFLEKHPVLTPLQVQIMPCKPNTSLL